MLDINKLYHLDCLEGFKQLDDNSVDLVLTDPPYNISKENRFNSMGRKGIDFGEWDKGFNQVDWIKAVAPKVKKGGSIVIFNSVQNIGTVIDALEANGFTYKQLGFYRKTNPMPRNRDRLYVTATEVFIWAVKGRGWTFNRQRETYENAIFDYPTVHHKERIHSTQKPVGLMEDLIKIHSNEGDLVLDCFSGSASTLIAAKNLNRSYIGFELDDINYKNSKDRLDKADMSEITTH